MFKLWSNKVVVFGFYSVIDGLILAFQNQHIRTYIGIVVRLAACVFRLPSLEEEAAAAGSSSNRAVTWV